jgi:hypothetical protein
VAGAQSTDADAKDELSRGKTLALSGIGIQVAAFGLFSIVAARFHFVSKQFAAALDARLMRAEGEKTAMLEGSKKKFNPNWIRILFAINASCVLILVHYPLHYLKWNRLTHYT